jgi:magnesium chelatase family protein
MYRSRVSGPLLDRIDVHVALPPVDVSDLRRTERGESTSAVQQRVARAREVQLERRKKRETRARTNATLGPRELERVAALSEEGAKLLGQAVQRLGLSARAYAKVLRVARTVADLDGSTPVLPTHLAEAVALRILDRNAQPTRAVA